METKLVIINNRTYKMETRHAKDMLKVIKDQVPARTIYAIEKNGIIQCVKDQYKEKAELIKAVREYTIKRYKVYYKA